MASAMWLRQELPVQRMRMRGFSIRIGGRCKLSSAPRAASPPRKKCDKSETYITAHEAFSATRQGNGVADPQGGAGVFLDNEPAAAPVERVGHVAGGFHFVGQIGGVGVFRNREAEKFVRAYGRLVERPRSDVVGVRREAGGIFEE